MSILGLTYRLRVNQAEADATYLLAGTFLVTWVLRTRIEKPSFAWSLKRPLTLHSTVEEQIGLMCACMPFFPAIVSNSPTLQKCIHSVQYLGSWTLKSSRYSSTAGSRRNYQKHVSRDGSVEDGLELQGRETFTSVTLPESPKKTPRMELRAFQGNERPESSWSKV